MQKFDMYLSDFVELYAFCLMPNHFHLLVKIKEKEELTGDAADRLFNVVFKIH